MYVVYIGKNLKSKLHRSSLFNRVRTNIEHTYQPKDIIDWEKVFLDDNFIQDILYTYIFFEIIWNEFEFRVYIFKIRGFFPHSF